MCTNVTVCLTIYASNFLNATLRKAVHTLSYNAWCGACFVSISSRRPRLVRHQHGSPAFDDAMKCLQTMRNTRSHIHDTQPHTHNTQTHTITIHTLGPHKHTFSTQFHSFLYPFGNKSPRPPNECAWASKASTWRREHPSPVSVARKNLQDSSTCSFIPSCLARFKWHETKLASYVPASHNASTYRVRSSSSASLLLVLDSNSEGPSSSSSIVQSSSTGALRGVWVIRPAAEVEAPPLFQGAHGEEAL